MMRPIGCPETSVHNYHSTLRNIPEERRYHVHRGGSLKSRIGTKCLRVIRFNFRLTQNNRPFQLVAGLDYQNTGNTTGRLEQR
jgi:hypothetical protein